MVVVIVKKTFTVKSVTRTGAGDASAESTGEEEEEDNVSVSLSHASWPQGRL